MIFARSRQHAAAQANGSLGGMATSAAAIATALGVTLAIPALAPLIFVGLALWTFRGYQQVVQSLTIAWLLTSLNPALYEGPTGLRWAVIGAAALSVMYHSGPSRSARTIWGSGLGVALLLLAPSVLFSSTLELAFFKLIGFAAGAFVVVSVLMSRPLIDRDWLNRWFAALFWVVVLPSVPLIVSDLGYVRNASGFQGILNHPQTLGVFLAPYAAIFVLSWLTKTSIPLSGLGAAVVVVILPLTEARVGVIAAIAGVIVALVASLLRHRRDVGLERRRVVLASFGVVSVVFLTFAVGYGGVVQDFATKSRSESLVQSFEISRGTRTRASIDNLVDSPIVGRGFGVPERIDEQAITTVAGFPISVPVEAGFAVTGLLEQSGVLGLLALLVLVAKTVWPTIRHGPIAASGLAAAALLTNLGEATITSFGGLGLVVWLMMGWATSLAIGSSRFIPVRRGH